jgi:hypothetical protein
VANLLPSLLASGIAPSDASPSRILGQLDALARTAESRDVPAPSWAVLIELDDPGLLEDLLARGLRVMLVLPQAWRVARLAEAIEDLNRPGLRLCGELLAAEAGEVCWYRYNDPRCDGTRSPQELQASRPNLRLDALEMRPLHTLDSLRHAWIERDGELEGEGVLLLSHAGQLELLPGADLLLNDLAALAWFGPLDAQPHADAEPVVDHGSEPEVPCRSLSDSLSARFLVPWPEAEPGHWWRRDVALEFKAERRSLQLLLASSTGQLEQLRAEREALALRQAELQAERDGMLQAQAEQVAQLAFQAAQAARWQQEHHSLQQESAAQRAAAEALQEDNRLCQEEAQRLSDQGGLLQQECLALQAELAALRAQLQEAQAGCAEALAERAQLQAGMAALQAEAERLREDLHEALRARQHQQDQLAGLTDRAEQSSRELEVLRQRLVLLIEAAAAPAAPS